MHTNGIYFRTPGVDPWDEQRDARTYAGPWPVVAHPPCARWCQLAHVVRARYGYEVGDDGGCFKAALASVRSYGGVLEHPALSIAWERFGLLKPSRRGWTSAAPGEWVCEVSQRRYGHRARKRTWLFYAGATPPLPMRWGHGATPTATVSKFSNNGARDVQRLEPKDAAATPPAFQHALMLLAFMANPTRARCE